MHRLNCMGVGKIFHRPYHDIRVATLCFHPTDVFRANGIKSIGEFFYSHTSVGRASIIVFWAVT